uniref:Uncharacterized protein n=1 Tax=Romanomermis culicivorax TaxID=13658 RepID=A0A915K4K0_ROMCU
MVKKIAKRKPVDRINKHNHSLNPEGFQEKTIELWCEECCLIYIYAIICKDLKQWYWPSDIG